jgi:hypothetical protein
MEYDHVEISDSEHPPLETAAAGRSRHIVGLSTVNPRRKCIVIAYLLCDSADYRYSIGIHTMFVRFLDNGEIARFSGIWFEALQ